MRIALAAAPFRNRDIAFNIKQIERQMRVARSGDARLVCFGEAFSAGL